MVVIIESIQNKLKIKKLRNYEKEIISINVSMYVRF